MEDDRDVFDDINEIDEFLSEDDEDIINIVEAPRRPRVFRNRPNHMQIWTDDEFLYRVRLSKRTVQHLYDRIGHNLEHTTQQLSQ